MEVSDLEQGLQYLSSAGVTLNLYELASLQAALLPLQKKQKNDKVYFWGRIRGQQDDYYIAYTMGQNDFVYPEKEFFFRCGRLSSQLHMKYCKLANFTPWRLLFLPVLVKLLISKWITVAWSAALFCLLPSDGPANRELTEADLLACLVQRIDNATSAVPRGAYRLHRNKVSLAAEFKGLSSTEAQLLSSWVHFRPADDLEALRAQTSHDYQFNTDFLESLEADVPRGSWVTRIDPITNCVTLRSLLWPGYVAYTVANTRAHGGAYFGDGEEALDLPFLL
ncbi:hypothetical protein Emed_006090 [Eimeria media]